jgi:hypothetical protein
MTDYKWYDPKVVQKGAYKIKPRAAVPKVAPNAPKVFYRILAISDNGETATVCSNMKKLTDGKLSVSEVDVQRFGSRIHVGDVLAYAAHDKSFKKPVVTHRAHQSHQFPKQLLASDEV